MNCRLIMTLSVCHFASAVSSPSQTADRLLWKFPTGRYVFSSPAIAQDGTIYIGSASSNLYALNPNGTLKWSFRTASEIQSSPAIDEDGCIYFGSGDGWFYSLNPDGSKRWEFATGDTIISSPCLGADGTIYVGSRDKHFYAIDREGKRKWSFYTGQYYTDLPAVIGPQGTLYFGVPGKVYALKQDGTRDWDADMMGTTSVSVVIGRGGRVYATSGGFDMRMAAFTHDGRRLWEFPFGSPTVLDHPSFPAIDSDGTIYVATSDSYLYAIHPNGTLKWKTPATRTQSSPALGDDGLIYLNSSWDFRLLCFDTRGSKQWEYLMAGSGSSGAISSFPTLKNGVVYTGSGNGNVYAIVASGDLAQTEWPTFGRNLQHSGRDIQRRIQATINPSTGVEELSLLVEVGRPYRIQGTTDLINWTDCASFVGTNCTLGIPRPAGEWSLFRLVSP